MGASVLSWRGLGKGPIWLQSPHLAAWQKRALAEIQRRVPQDPERVWVLSSGTQSVNQIKCIGLTRSNIVCSAESVNRHLSATAADRWLLAIPDYHIGGFAILARAALSGAQVVRLPRWSAGQFIEQVQDQKITLTSLVPTQIFDLVRFGQRAPASLRAIVVGGGALSPALYKQARDLAWPVLPSYGLTETASQIATAPLDSLLHKAYPALRVLDHARVELRAGRVLVGGGSVCDWLAIGRADGSFNLEDPRREGWLPTEDMAEWAEEGSLYLHGRRDQVIKRLGVLVGLAQVESDVRQAFATAGVDGRVAVVAVSAEREGAELISLTDTASTLAAVEAAVSRYNSRVPGPQRLRRWAWVPEVMEGELHKVKRAELMARLRLR